MERVIVGSAMRSANGRLSIMLSELMALSIRRSKAHEEIDAFHAPSECHHDVANAHERAVLRFFDYWGITPEDLIAEVESRCGSKAILQRDYMFSLVEAANIWAEREERRMAQRRASVNLFRLRLEPLAAW